MVTKKEYRLKLSVGDHRRRSPNSKGDEFTRFACCLNGAMLTGFDIIIDNQKGSSRCIDSELGESFVLTRHLVQRFPYVGKAFPDMKTPKDRHWL